MCLQDKKRYITKRPLLEQRDDSHHLISLYKRMLGFHGLWGHSVGVIFFFYCTNYFLSPYPKPKPTLTQIGYDPAIYKLCKVKIHWYYYHCGDI